MPNVETMSRPRLPVEYDRITERFPITQDPDRRPVSETVSIQGTHGTGKMDKKNPCQGKHRE